MKHFWTSPSWLMYSVRSHCFETGATEAKCQVINQLLLHINSSLMTRTLLFLTSCFKYWTKRIPSGYTAQSTHLAVHVAWRHQAGVTLPHQPKHILKQEHLGPYTSREDLTCCCNTRASCARAQLKPTGSSWSNRLMAGTGYVLFSSTPQHCGVLLIALLAGHHQYCLWYWCKWEEPEATWACLCMLGEWQCSVQPWVEVLPGIKGLNGSAQKAEGQNIQHLTWTCLHFYTAHTVSHHSPST